MNIKFNKVETELTFFLQGHLDTVTVSEIQNEIENQLASVTKLILDFTEALFFRVSAFVSSFGQKNK